MACPQLKPYPKSIVSGLKIFEWTDANTKIEHHLSDVYFYPDDSRMKILIKLQNAFGWDTLPYAWYKPPGYHKLKPVLFDFATPTEWDGYDINPFLANPTGDVNFKIKLLFNDKKHYPLSATINIINPLNFPKLFQKNRHYFVDYPHQPILKNQEDRLQKWWDLYNETTPVNECSTNFADFKGTLKKKPILFNDIFDRIHASNTIPFIQWISTSNKILYKIYEKHKIPSLLIESWMSYQRIFYQQKSKQSAIICYSSVSSSVFARAYITELGQIQITYKMDANQKIDINLLEEHLSKFRKQLEDLFETKMSIEPVRINIRTQILVVIKDLVKVYKFIAKALPLFQTTTPSVGTLDMIYQRGSHDKMNVNIPEYIITELEQGTMITEIQNTLKSWGISQEDIESYMTEVQNIAAGPGVETAVPRKPGVTKKDVNVRLNMRVIHTVSGMDVNIQNAASIDEARSALHWLQVLIVAADTEERMPSAEVLSEAELEFELSSIGTSTPRSIHRSMSVRSESSGLSELSVSRRSESSGLSGGVGDGYLITELKKKDPKLFELSENNRYATACQQKFQPVVITVNEKNALKQKGKLDLVSPYLEHGSSVENLNVYICPKRWCPTSRVPIGFGQTCPDGEPSMDFYKLSSFNTKGIPDNKWTSEEYDKIHRYVYFLKSKSVDGLNVPCCGKKLFAQEYLDAGSIKPKTVPPKLDIAGPSTPIRAPVPSVQVPSTGNIKQDTTYIFKREAPIEPGRYGDIPKAIHEQIFPPGVDYGACMDTITMKQCLLRKGIKHNQDSLMNAIAYQLNFKDKASFIEHIKKNLSPTEFLCLENGRIAAAFAPTEIEQYHIINAKHWIMKDTNFVKWFGIDSNLPLDMRYLIIYISYRRYIEHLASNEPKSGQHIMGLLKRFNILLILWDKDIVTSGAASISCPYFQTVEELYLSMSQHQDYVMLLMENGYYEPLELKRKNSDGIQKIPKSMMKNTLKILKQCNHKQTVPEFLEKLINLKNWMKIHYANAPNKNEHAFETIVLSPAYTILAIITKSKIWLTLPRGGIPLTFLSTCMKQLELTNIIYQEDLLGTIFKTNFAFDGFLPILTKLTALQIEYNIGVYNSSETTGTVNMSKPLTVENLRGKIWSGNYVLEYPKDVFPLLPIPEQQTVQEKEISANDKKWFQLQLAIAKTLWIHYDTLVVPILEKHKTRKNRTEILMNTFQMILPKHRKRVQIILEEIPYSAGKESVWQYMRNLSVRTKYPFYEDKYYYDKKHKEWIFSQVGIESVRSKIINPPKGPRPDERYHPTKDIVIDATSITDIDSARISTTIEKFPKKFLSQTEESELPSKWTGILKTDWKQYTIRIWNKYNENTLPNYLNWIASRLGVYFNIQQVNELRNEVMRKCLRNADTDRTASELLIRILKDNTMLSEWRKLSKAKYNAQDIWEHVIQPQNIDERFALWKRIYDLKNMHLTTLDMYHIAKLLDCTIFVIMHKKGTPEFKQEEAVEKKRADLSDFVATSTMYTPHFEGDADTQALTNAKFQFLKKKPFLLLFSKLSEDKKYMTYHPIMHTDTEKLIYDKLENTPKDVQSLVEYHIKKIRIFAT